jgi:hypothetical protein
MVYRNSGVVFGLSGQDEERTARLVTSMAVTNLVLVAPLLTLARRWVLPLGTVTILYATVGALCAAITGFGNVEMIAGLLVAGVLVDLLARWLRPTPDRPLRYRAFAALAPLTTWTIYLATAYLTSPPLDLPVDPVHPEGAVELYTGAPIVQALLGLLLAILLVPSRPEPSR